MEVTSEANAAIYLVTVLAVSEDLVVVRPVSELPSYVSIVRIPALAMAESAQSTWLNEIMSSKNVILAAQPSENGEMIGELFIDGVPLAAHIASISSAIKPPEIYPWTKVIEHAHLNTANIWVRNFYDITHLVFMLAVAAVLIGVLSMRFDRSRNNRQILSRWWARAAFGWFGFGPETINGESSDRNAGNKPKSEGS